MTFSHSYLLTDVIITMTTKTTRISDTSLKNSSRSYCEPLLADLSLKQTISNTPLVLGSEATFTLRLNNSGPANATGVKIQDLLPAGFSFVNASTSLGTYDSKTGIWDVGNIKSGRSATLVLTGKVVNATSPDAYTNIAEIIAANQRDPDSVVNNRNPNEDDYTSVTAPVVKLDLSKKFTKVTKEVDGNNDGKPEQYLALPGDDVSFQIQVTNNGAVNATNVKILDDMTQVLPIGLTLQSLSLDGGVNLDTAGGGDGNAQTVEVLFNSIAPGETKTITVNAKVSTDNVKTANLSGQIGTIDPLTGNINSELPEYYNTPFNGTFFLHYNVQKNANQPRANFGLLNITNQAEIVGFNGSNLKSGSITASARLDVSSFKIAGTLNNGQQFTIYSIEDLLDPSSTPGSYIFNPDPDVEPAPKAYPTNNQSEFLPPGQTGSASFFASWLKNNDPQYLADLAVWDTLQADGDLSNIEDEKAVVDALFKFIEDGVYSRDRFDNGSFTLDNGTQTETIEFNAGEFSPGTTDFVNVAVTDTSAVVTDRNGNSVGTFRNLQAALDSFNFTNPTDVNVTINDANGDKVVRSRLQQISTYNFEKNWSIQNITIGNNINQVILASGNKSANIDLSQVNITNPIQNFQLQGNNAKDTITGSRFNDVIVGGNADDILSGFDGNDSINGGNGCDLLTGGRGNDILTGGLGADDFIFGINFGKDIITDFCKGQDKIDLRELKLVKGILDTNGDRVLNLKDSLVSLTNHNLQLDLTSLNGGTITFTGVTAVNINDFIF